MIYIVTLFCYPWAYPQLVHGFIVLVYADLFNGNFQTFVKYYKNRVFFCFFRGVFRVK